MIRFLLALPTIAAFVVTTTFNICRAAGDANQRPIQEEVWALPVALPTLACVVRPVGAGPFPLVVMNHGVSLNAQERAFFPLVEFRDAAMWFGRTARTPMLWIYIENDTFFGPALPKQMHQAYTSAGGNAEYHLLPPFGSDGHFLIDSAESIPLWAPLVSRFLDRFQ